MAKEDDVVAAAMAKPIREGYPILTEEHPFFGKTTTPPNTVTKLLNKYWYRLKCRDGIVIYFRRTNQRRIIEIFNLRQP